MYEPFGVGPRPEKTKGKKRPFEGKVSGFVPARRAEVRDGKIVLVDDEPSESHSFAPRQRGA